MSPVTTFAGTALPLCQVLRRPRRPGRIRRSRHTPTPAAWYTLWVERLKVGKDLAWDAWQSFTCCEYSDVKALAQQILLWSHCPETPAALVKRGVTPEVLMKCVELCVSEARLTVKEAALLEEALLEHLTPEGRWKE